jgi:hypothetical protein
MTMNFAKICVSTLLLVPAAAFAASAFDGTWKLSLQHYQLSKKPVVLLLINGEYTCKSCLSPTTIKADGTDQKIAGDPNRDAEAVTVVDANTVTAVNKLGGKAVASLKFVVARDGKSAERVATSLVGTEPTVYTLRVARIADAPAGAHALSGTWREAKMLSASGPGTLVTYGMSDDGFTMSSNGQSYTAKFDDKSYPVAGDPSKTKVTLKKVSDTEVVESDRQRGKVVETLDMTVSADGKLIHVVDTEIHDMRVSHYDLTKTP